MLSPKRNAWWFSGLKQKFLGYKKSYGKKDNQIQAFRNYLRNKRL